MTKMRKLALVACVACFALAVLCACQEKTPELQGTWVLDSIEAENDAIAMSAEEVDVMQRSLGMPVTLKLKETGDATFDMFGYLMRGSWTQESETSGTLTISDYGESVEQSLADGATMDESEMIEGVAFNVKGQNLRIAIDGATYVFIRADSEEALAAQENAAVENVDTAEGDGAAAEAESSEEAAA